MANNQEQRLPIFVEPLPNTVTPAVIEQYRQLNYVRMRIGFYQRRVDENLHSVTFLQNTLKQLKALQTRVETAESKLMVTAGIPNGTDILINILEDMQNELGEELKVLLASEREERTQLSQRNPTTHATTSINQPSVPRFSEIQLPTLSMPQFDGTPKNWLKFSRFVNDVLIPHHATEASKVVYLSNSLNEEAKSILASAGDSSFHTAWDLLKSHYENNEALINELMEEIYVVKKPTANDAVTLSAFVTMIRMNLNYLKSLQVNVESWDPFFSYHLLKNIDVASRMEFEKQRETSTLVKTEELLLFLEKRVKILKSVTRVTFTPSSTSTPIQKPKLNTGTKHKPTHQAMVANPNEYKCPLCKEPHFLYACDKIRTMTIEERRKVVGDSQICFNCMRPNHTARKCTSKSNCRECNRRHHTLLHSTYSSETSSGSSSNSSNSPSNSYKPPLNNPSGSGSSQPGNQQSVNQTGKPKPEELSNKQFVGMARHGVSLLATAMVFITDRYGREVPCRAFLDAGSTVSFITVDLADKLKLPKQKVFTIIDGINGTESLNKHQVTTTVSSRLSNYNVEVDLLVTRKITGDMPQQSILLDESKLPINYELADPSYNQTGQIDILLGAEIFYEVFDGNKITLSDGLFAYPTHFGLIIAGKMKQPTRAFTFMAIDELRKQIQKFWEVEHNFNQPYYSIEEKAAEAHFVEHVKRRHDLHYEVALPFKSNLNELGNSAIKSKSLFLAAEKRLSRYPLKKTHYNEFMQEIIDMGHMTQVPYEANDDNCYFMTHHLISRPQSTTTKYRVVFNASFKTTTGLSLNDVLLIGPTIQSDLFQHLLQWREFKIVLIADLEKMYRMIYVQPEDRKYQQIWWRSNPKDELKAWQLNVVTYGTASAPFQAQRVLKQLAHDEVNNYPDVAAELEKKFYMDDYVSSHPDIIKAQTVKSRLSQLCQRGGFNLRKWKSNEPTLEDGEALSSPVTTVLGVQWNPAVDSIIIDFSTIKPHEHLTKCSVLSETAQFFDPLGLAAPIVIIAKTFMQKLWTNQLNWDDGLSDDLSNEWLEYRHTLIKMEPIYVDRPFLTYPGGKFTIHGFGDASTTAYGACVYIVNDGKSTLMSAKSRVAPLKTITIPRLELCAAVLLTQLVHKVIQSLESSPQATYYWTDSEITYFRIHSVPTRFKTFVASRVAEIQQLTSTSEWRIVPSEHNPADIVSRGETADLLKQNKLWWYGPRFIFDKTEPWPTQKFINLNTEDEEYRKITLVAVQIEESDIIRLVERFSSIKTLIRTGVQMLRFFLNCKKLPKYRLVQAISLQEEEEVLLRITRALQEYQFEEVLKLLRTNRELPTSHSLAKLTPFIDVDGLLRVGGRLQQVDLVYDLQHQLILNKSHFTKLLMEDLHRRNLHAGPLALFGFSRQKYWIIGGRNQAKTVVHNCMICFRSKPKLMNQIMGDLPADRVLANRAFDVVGVDYCGPFNIKPLVRSKTTRKSYVSLFTCLTTRCCHLELVHDLTTTSFLNGLRRFISRRGIPRKILSDNATNLVGGRKVLEELRELLLSETHDEQVKQFCNDHRIIWQHIPARSPHWGGVWESMVKQFKYYFKRELLDSYLYIDEIETLIIQVEAVLNSRPLTPISTSPDDLNYLTPGHFLIGQPLNLIPEPTWKNDNPGRLKNWQLIQQITTTLWERFQRDYVSELQRRHKWLQTQDDIKVGSMVLLHDDLPPTQWRLGRVVKIHLGHDNHVRAVTIKTVAGLLNRSIAKIAPLPFNN